MLSHEKQIAPMEAGWYAVCLRTCSDYHEQFPMTKPEVVYYDGKSDHVCYDPDLPGRGGIAGIDSVVWWGSIVPNKPVPDEMRSPIV